MKWFIAFLAYIAILAVLASNVFGLAWALFLQIALLTGVLLVGAIFAHSMQKKDPKK
jgi:Mn2+/Fe2+ NRAMP family transporter